MEETAGADAPRRGIKLKAAVIHAIVLAVPITLQVPAYIKVNRRSYSWIKMLTVSTNSSFREDISSILIVPALKAA